MGADGGYCYLHCTDSVEFHRLFGCFLWRYANQSCRAIKGSRSEDLEPGDPGPDYIEGGYGTDCDSSFEDVVAMVALVLDDRECWHAMPTDPRDLTFRELIEDLVTDPEFNMKSGLFRIHVPWDYEWLRWWAIREFRTLAEHLAGSTQGYSFATIYEHILDMTLREWCQALRKIGCDHAYTEETWT
jgi:hypothetical protein